MNGSDAPPDPYDDTPDAAPHEDDAFEEVRQAAGAVVASLKWLIEATERVVEDPGAFARAVDSGRGLVDAFVGGFGGAVAPDNDAPDDDDTAEGPEEL